MEALEIIMPTLQERFDRITASVAQLDPAVGGPWPKLHTLNEYMISVADSEKPRCQKCRVNLLWAQSILCVGCGTKTELGLQKPREIEFTSTLVYNRFIDALLATGRLKNEDSDKQGGGSLPVVGGGLDGPDSRRGSASTGSTEVRRGSGIAGSDADIPLESTTSFQRGQRPSVANDAPGCMSTSQASTRSGGSGSIRGSETMFQSSGQSEGSEALNGPDSALRKQVLSSAKRPSLLSQLITYDDAVHPSQGALPRSSSDQSGGVTGWQASVNSRTSNGLPEDEFFSAPTSSPAAQLTGLGDFEDSDQFQSAPTYATSGSRDFTGFDSEDFFARQPDTSGFPATSSDFDSVRSGDGFFPAEGNLFINQLEGLDLAQSSIEPSFSDHVLSTLLSEMHDLSFMLTDRLVIPSS